MSAIKRFILTSSTLPYVLIFGGLLLLSSKSFLMVHDIAERESILVELILPISTLLILIGAYLRFYHAKREGTLKFFLIKMLIGVIILISMMATDVAHTPTFLQNIF